MNLPDGWKIVKLGDIATKIGSGITPKGGRAVYQKKGVPIIRSQNVLWGNLSLDDVARITIEQHQKMKSTLVKENDILLNITGASIGRCCFVPKGTEESNVNQHVCIIRLDRTNYPKYILDTLLSFQGQRQIALFQAGGNRQGLNFEQIASIELKVPSFPEQKAIADLLSTWDAAIEKTEQLITAKEKQFQWLLDELITKPSKSGKWKNQQLSNLCDIVKGQQLNVENMTDCGQYYALNGGVSPSGRTNRWNTPENTITISEGGNSCGFVNFNTDKFWAGGHCYVLLNVEEKSIDVKYLFHYLKLKEPKIMKLRVGSGLPNIQKKDIDAYPVLLPQLQIQAGIAKILDLYRSEINLLLTILNKYKHQKCGLMRNLLNGQWRLKEFK